MTSLLLGPQQMTPDSSTRSAGHLDRVTDVIEMDSSKLLAIAKGLSHNAQHWPGMAEPTRRVWDLIAASPVFEAWVISWPPGGAIELHDHGGSGGAVVVASGELVEVVVAEGQRGVHAATSTVLPASASVTFGKAHVHEIVNLGRGPAISVHVYAPRLTTMTYYEFSNGLLEARATVHYQLGAAIP
jgi:predicted metal-dependent enzyme (double-stranded beta helix superfamily)